MQRELQNLLDAQSAGLLSGLGIQAAPSNGSSTSPTASHASSRASFAPGPIHLPSPPRQKPKLRTLPLTRSRQQIHKYLLQLSELKVSESSAFAAQHDSLQSFLANLSRLVSKKAGIESSIQNIISGPDSFSQRITHDISFTSLAEEEAALSAQIHALETQLYELRAKLGHIKRQRVESKNREQARLSSWRGALEEVEKTIRREILEGRGLEETYPSLLRTNRRQRDGVWALARERRTVEMVRDEVEGKAKTLDEARESAETEGEACRDGADVWEVVVQRVESVEKRLRAEMRRVRGKENGNASTDTDTDGANNAEQGMVTIVKLMGNTVRELEEELQRAEMKGWNLLVCAIGAEAEAMKEGREMLLEALAASGTTIPDSSEHEASTETPGTASMMTARSRLADEEQKADWTELSNSEKMKRKGKSKVDGAAEEINDTDTDRPLVDIGDNTKIDPLGALANESHEEDEDDDAPGPEFLVEHVD